MSPLRIVFGPDAEDDAKRIDEWWREHRLAAIAASRDFAGSFSDVLAITSTMCVRIGLSSSSHCGERFAE